MDQNNKIITVHDRSRLNVAKLENVVSNQIYKRLNGPIFRIIIGFLGKIQFDWLDIEAIHKRYIFDEFHVENLTPLTMCK